MDFDQTLGYPGEGPASHNSFVQASRARAEASHGPARRGRRLHRCRNAAVALPRAAGPLPAARRAPPRGAGAALARRTGGRSAAETGPPHRTRCADYLEWSARLGPS